MDTASQQSSQNNSRLLDKPNQTDSSQDAIFNEKQYGKISPKSSSPQTQVSLITEIRDIERRLDSGWYRFYLFWQYLLIIFAVLDFIQATLYIVTGMESWVFLSSYVVSFYMLYQCSLEVQAIQHRNSFKANKGVILMSIYVVINTLTILGFALLLVSFLKTKSDSDDDNTLEYYIILLLSGYSTLLLVHLCITLFGAIKVRKILRRRDELLKLAAQTNINFT